MGEHSTDSDFKSQPCFVSDSWWDWLHKTTPYVLTCLLYTPASLVFNMQQVFNLFIFKKKKERVKPSSSHIFTSKILWTLKICSIKDYCIKLCQYENDATGRKWHMHFNLKGIILFEMQQEPKWNWKCATLFSGPCWAIQELQNTLLVGHLQQFRGHWVLYFKSAHDLSNFIQNLKLKLTKL